MNTIKNKCERKNMCHDEPCGENAKCIPRGTDNFECKCRWGYQGKHSVISQQVGAVNCFQFAVKLLRSIL